MQDQASASSKRNKMHEEELDTIRK